MRTTRWRIPVTLTVDVELPAETTDQLAHFEADIRDAIDCGKYSEEIEFESAEADGNGKPWEPEHDDD